MERIIEKVKNKESLTIQETMGMVAVGVAVVQIAQDGLKALGPKRYSETKANAVQRKLLQFILDHAMHTYAQMEGRVNNTPDELTTPIPPAHTDALPKAAVDAGAI